MICLYIASCKCIHKHRTMQFLYRSRYWWQSVRTSIQWPGSSSSSSSETGQAACWPWSGAVVGPKTGGNAGTVRNGTHGTSIGVTIEGAGVVTREAAGIAPQTVPIVVGIMVGPVRHVGSSRWGPRISMIDVTLRLQEVLVQSYGCWSHMMIVSFPKLRKYKCQC